MIVVETLVKFLLFPGKTMENLRNRKKIVLVNNRRSASWQNSKPTFKRFAIFDENLVGIELSQTNIVLDKPIYVSRSVRFSILLFQATHSFRLGSPYWSCQNY